MTFSRAASIACLVLAAAAAAAQEQAAPPPVPSLPDKLGDAPGTWDLSRDGSNRRCVMTLLPDNGEAGRRLAFPAGCRRALPVVSGMAGWLFTDGAVRLVDRNVRPILVFSRRPDQRSLVANAEGGESYSLVPLDIVAMRPPASAFPTTLAPADPEAPGLRPSTALAPLQTPPTVPAELMRAPGAAPALPGEPVPAPGTYALDRFQERDTCRLALDGSGGGVRVVPGCKDGGLEVFDPVRWRYAQGRITLTSKRGHSIELVPSGDGRWRRDPEVGTTFLLRRIEP